MNRIRYARAVSLTCAALLSYHFALAQDRTIPSKNADQEGWMPPDPQSIPQGPEGDSIRLGRSIFKQTPTFAAKFVGDRQSCSDCHINGGTVAYAAPVVGLPGLFPMFNQRANRVIGIEDRIQECFVRSENGQPLSYDGVEMTSILSYMHWLSQGQVSGKPFPGRGLVALPKLMADEQRGASIYASQCSACHGADGAGHSPAFPPVWGPGAYNDGAGMNKVEKMAAFLQHNMPQNRPGSLTAQQSYDVAAYIRSKPHTHFNQAYSIY